jgi:hypothetical protein
MTSYTGLMESPLLWSTSQTRGGRRGPARRHEHRIYYIFTDARDDDPQWEENLAVLFFFFFFESIY